MNNKSLVQNNPFLKGKKSTKRRVRSLASSTAIETGEAINKIEDKINHLRHSRHRVILA